MVTRTKSHQRLLIVEMLAKLPYTGEYYNGRNFVVEDIPDKLDIKTGSKRYPLKSPCSKTCTSPTAGNCLFSLGFSPICSLLLGGRLLSSLSIMPSSRVDTRLRHVLGACQAYYGALGSCPVVRIIRRVPTIISKHSPDNTSDKAPVCMFLNIGRSLLLG